MRKYLLVFLFFFIFAAADFLVTFVNILPDASNEANPLAKDIYANYGSVGFIVSGLIYGLIILFLLFLIKLKTEPKYAFEKRHAEKIIKIRKYAILLTLSLVIFGGASHFSAFLTWLYVHYSILSWFDFVRMTALSAPIAFIIGTIFGRKI